MDIGNLLLAFWDPGIGKGFVHALAVIVNLAFIVAGVTLLAYMCHYLRSRSSKPPEQLRKKPTAAHYAAAIGITSGLIALSVFAVLDQSQGTLVSGSYSLSDLARLIIAIFDPLLDIRHFADSPIKELFGLNLIVRAAIIYILAATLQFSVKQAGNVAVHFNTFLKEKLLAGQPTAESSSSVDEIKEAAKNEIQTLIARLGKFFISGGAAIFATYVLGSDDMRENISEVLKIFNDIISMMTLLPNVGTGEGASGFFSDVLYILLSLVMLAVYVTAALLLIIFIHTILKNWPTIVNWLVTKAKAMRTGMAAILLAVASLAIVIGTGICLRKYPILQLSFEGGPVETLRIVVNYAVVILVIVIILMLLVFAASFLALVVSYAWNTVKQKCEAWKKDFGSDKYWNIAKAAACVILAGILLIIVALCYDKLRDWLMGIFNPGEDIFSPTQTFKHAALFAVLLEGLVLLISTAAVLGFIVFWGIVDFFLTTRKDVVATASKLVRETLTTLLDTLSLAPFTLKQACLLAKSVILLIKSVVQTVLQIFTGYRTESDKNNAIFMAACFASLASLLNTFFGLYQFYGGGEDISGYSDWIRTICTLAIACAAQLAMLVFGMKAGEGLAEWRITGGSHAKDRLVRIILRIGLAAGVIASAGCLYILCSDFFLSGTQFLDLVKYILWFVGMLATVGVLCWQIRKRKKQDNNSQANSTGEEPALVETPSPPSVPNRLRMHQRLPFYWYLTVYLLLMIVSTGFAYSNLFGYYAHGAKVHERIYSQVRYEVDYALQLSERVAEVVNNYAKTTRQLGSLFSRRAARAMQERDSILTDLRSRADGEPSGEYEEENRRDRFIGTTKDLEQVISNIQSFLTAQYDTVGSTAVIEVEEYAHYWGYSPQPSYSTTCIVIHLDGSLDSVDNNSDDANGNAGDGASNSEGTNDNADDAASNSNGNVGAPNNGQIITVGDFIEDKTLTEFPETAHPSFAGNNAPEGRIVDPASPSQSIIKTTRYVLHADKYDILKELFNQYERMENQIYGYTIPVDNVPDFSTFSNENSAFSSTKIFPQRLTLNNSNTIETISDQIYPYLDTNAQLDGIRASIVALYHDSIRNSASSSEVQTRSDQTTESVPMPELPRIAEAYLNGNDTNSSYAHSKVESQGGDGADEITALSEYDKLSDYIDRALALNSILLSFDTKDNPGKTDAIYKTQQYRNYARGIAHLEFQISYDALFRGHFDMNPVRSTINELYTTSAIAIFLLLICLLIDMLAFFSGLLLFKSIYLFGKDAGILQMGYLNYEIALSNLFTIPKDPHSRVLHLAFIYRVLHGNASVPAKPEANDIGDLPPDNNTSEPTRHTSDSLSESDHTVEILEGVAPTETPDSTDSVIPDQSSLDEYSPAEEESADSEDAAPNPQSASADASETKEALPKEEASIHDSDCNPEEAMLQQDELHPSEQAEEGQENEDSEKVARYFQDMDYLHQIMCSEDYKKLDKNMIVTLKILGITEFSDGGKEQNSSYASLQLWLRSFVEENNITFDELFPPQEDE